MKSTNTQTELLRWWIAKYSPLIVNYINTVVHYEEMTAEQLEERRRSLLLEFIDSCDSALLYYLLNHVDGFLDMLYLSVFPHDSLIEMEAKVDENA